MLLNTQSMKRITCLTLSFLIIAQSTYAQLQARASINAATVFLNGAELYSNARVTLPQGESDVLFTNIAGSVNPQSLNIGAENGVVVQSATFQNNYLADSSISPRGRKLQDTIALMERSTAVLADKKTVVDEQLSVIKENKKVSGQNNGLSVTELQKLLDLLNTRMNMLLTAQRTLTTAIDDQNVHLFLLKSQLAEEQKKAYQPGGQLLVKFYAPQSITTSISMTYVVPNAGWTPAYDLRVDKVNDPVKLFYKANIFQNCGVKWTNIRLSLSTGNPNEGVNAPVLTPTYLSFFTNTTGETLETKAYKSANNQSLSLNGGRMASPKISADGELRSQENTTINDYT